MVGKPDPFVAAVCEEECRSLLTLDLAFSDIQTYPPANFHGIIVLRPLLACGTNFCDSSL
jgi:hypothetical protein